MVNNEKTIDEADAHKHENLNLTIFYPSRFSYNYYNIINATVMQIKQR